MRGGPGSSFGVLLAKLNLFSSAEALDRSDAIAQIDSKLRKIINVAVRIDEAGNNRPARGVDFVNAAREFDFRADGFDSTVSDEQRRVLDRGTARPHRPRVPVVDRQSPKQLQRREQNKGQVRCARVSESAFGSTCRYYYTMISPNAIQI